MVSKKGQTGTSGAGKPDSGIQRSKDGAKTSSGSYSKTPDMTRRGK